MGDLCRAWRWRIRQWREDSHGEASGQRPSSRRWQGHFQRCSVTVGSVAPPVAAENRCCSASRRLLRRPQQLGRLQELGEMSSGMGKVVSSRRLGLSPLARQAPPPPGYTVRAIVRHRHTYHPTPSPSIPLALPSYSPTLIVIDPIDLEVIEILFQEGLIKCLFATETFNIGLNMPAKTVVFTNVHKFDGDRFRWLSSGEYIQMSGVFEVLISVWCAY
ncbi:hypothetical protein ZWY2020_023834 [Hordeum vulgare]|nr:hypothetical protein ZWY2020_023834 [Hordeum vulgare]